MQKYRKRSSTTTTIKVKRETLKYLKMAQGVYQLVTGRRWSYDRIIRDMAANVVISQAEIASKALEEFGKVHETNRRGALRRSPGS